MADSKTYLVATVVDDFIDDNNLGQGFWMKGLKWAQRGLRRIRLDVFQQPCSCLLEVSERKTVILPDGFIDWTKVAVKRGQYAITLAVNNELTIGHRSNNEDTVRGLLSQHMPNGTDFAAYGGYQFYNYSGGSLYGIGQGLPGKGYFKIVDRDTCKEMLLDYDYNFSHIYLEYITDGLGPCEKTVIHPYEYEYLMTFMDMMYEKKNNPKATLGSKREAELDVDAEERKLRARYNDLTPQDIITMSRAEARMTTKL